MRRIHWAFPAAALCLVGAIVTSCALLQRPSPTTTVTDASGQERVLDWSDYPGEPYAEPADVLAAPRAEEAERFGEALLDDLERAIDAHASDLDWRRGEPGGLYEHGGNGYGGETLHRTYNSAERSTADVPDDWPALAAALDAELAQHGFGSIEWEFAREPFEHQTAAERDAEVVETHGSLNPDEMWQWFGAASNGTTWVHIALIDTDRGVGAPEDAIPAAPRLLALGVGATVIDAADEQAYRDGTAPFEGLDRPDSTHSD